MNKLNLAFYQGVSVGVSNGLDVAVDSLTVHKCMRHPVVHDRIVKCMSHWDDYVLMCSMRSRFGDPIDKGRLSYAITNDAMSWGTILAWTYMVPDGCDVRRSLCGASCEVCKTLYTDAQGHPLTLKSNDLVSGDVNNLQASLYRVVGDDDKVLQDLNYGHRTVGSSHWWDQTHWELVA